MSEELFEIAFSGQIVEGADLQSVKQHISQIFKADATRLQQLFSGRRVLIKREADKATVIKYQAAFKKAGAICEIKSLNEADSAQQAEPGPDKNRSNDQPYESKYPESDLVPQALLSTPLGIDADQIQPLNADMAPVGSPMQHQIKDPPEPSFDLSGLEVAPVGSVLSTGEPKDLPAPPDTSNLSLADQ